MSEWHRIRLGDVVSIKHGWPFKGNLCEEELTGGPIVVSIGNFKYTGGFRFNDTRTREYRGDYPSEYELTSDDILLIMTCQTSGGEILGIPGRVPDDGRIYLHNQRIGKVILDKPEEVDANFLYWVFLWPEFNHYLYLTASGTKILHTSPGRIEDFRFELPPLPIQRRIAEILGRLDDKIEVNRRINRTLEQMAQALYKHWFVDFGPFQDGEFVESEVGLIPAGWSVKTIGEVCKVVNGSTPSTKIPEYWEGGEICWTTPTDMTSLASPVILDTSRKITQLGLDNCSASLLPVGSVLMTSRATLGVVAINYVPMATNQGFKSMICGPSATAPFMLLYVQHNRDEILSHASGTTFLEINSRNFKALKVVIPPLPVMQAFTCHVQLLFDRIHANEAENVKLAATRDYLLPKLLSGAVDVSGSLLDEDEFAGQGELAG